MFVKDNAVKDRFVELRAQGRSFAAIAGELGVGKSTLIGWSKDLADEVSNLRQVELEATREKYRLHRERRMELFGKQLDAIEAELFKRSFEHIPTERLLDLALKLNREIAQGEQPIVFKTRVSAVDPDPDMFMMVKEWQA